MKRKAIAATIAAAALAGSLLVLPQAPSCRAKDGLPDARCTPGVVNPNVTQANIRETICVKGWTDTIRPSESYTNNLKVGQMRRYELTGVLSDYEEDHLISLELGGHPTDPKNLWPEPWEGPNNAHDKDVMENRLHKAVCENTMSLAEAQRRIRTDWRQN